MNKENKKDIIRIAWAYLGAFTFTWMTFKGIVYWGWWL